MDSVGVVLSIAIVLVVILLLRCRNKKPVNPTVIHQMVAGPTPVSPKTTVGTAKQNKDFQERYKELANMSGYEDYGAVAQYMSLEPEVYESHARFSDDLGASSPGASMMSVRDDPNDTVPWVGGIRPRYHDIFSSGIGAVSEPSETPDQLRGNSNYCIG